MPKINGFKPNKKQGGKYFGSGNGVYESEEVEVNFAR